MKSQTKTTLIIITTAALVLAFAYFLYAKEKPESITETLPTLSPKEEEKTEEKPAPEVSFQALLERSYQAPGLKMGEVIERGEKYTKHAVTYQSDELTISGVLYLPTDSAPASGYPVLIANHGYIDPAVYTTGRGLKREQEYFASRGYVVLHPDYRNHAGSTKTGDDPIKDRLGYITDIIHAVESLKSSSITIDKNNITLLGHSMGGGASLAAVLVKPDVATRAVLYAPVTINYLDSYLRYQSNDPDRASKVAALYGTPEQNPDFWKGLNGEPYLERLAVPVQIYHGTNDKDVPYDWATKMRDQLKSENKTVELITYEGEGHEFSFAWTEFMEGVFQFTQNK